MSDHYGRSPRAPARRRLPLTMPSAVTGNRSIVRPPSLTIGPYTRTQFGLICTAVTHRRGTSVGTHIGGY
jgi:hypothetical protein